MSELFPLACADCQNLLALGPDFLDYPGVRDHLVGCATCRCLFTQYGEIDTLLNHLPEVKPLPDLAQHFQKTPQFRQMADLKGSVVDWEDIGEELLASPLSRLGMHDEPATPSFSHQQGATTMQKSSLIPDPEASPVLRHGQFQQPANPVPRPHRSRWGASASAAILLVALTTICVWLLPHLLQPGAPSTPLSAVPTSSWTQQRAFTEQDSGKTVTYPTTTIFTLNLDERLSSQRDLSVVCQPEHTLTIIANTASATRFHYLVSYQALVPGTCTIANGSFTLTVVVTGKAATLPTEPAPTSTATFFLNQIITCIDRHEYLDTYV